MDNVNYFTMMIIFAFASLISGIVTSLLLSNVYREYFRQLTIMYFTTSLILLALYILDDF
jgi:hypothetical protein